MRPDSVWRRWRDLNSRAGERPTYRISSADPSTTWVHLRIPLEPRNFITFPRHLQPFPAKIRPRFCRTTIHLGQLNKKGMRNRSSCVKVKLPHKTFRKETIFLMSKSITQDMAYRHSLMKYAEKYGVSRASRKYNKSRSYIYNTTFPDNCQGFFQSFLKNLNFF